MAFLALIYVIYTTASVWSVGIYSIVSHKSETQPEFFSVCSQQSYKRV